MENKNYELIKFEDGDFSLDVNVSPNEETVWLNRMELSLLFDRDIKTIGKHINNILREEYSDIEGVIAKIATTANDGKTYMVEYYNLDMILAVGYRVKSKRGIMFRRWANSILKQYLMKGHVVNESRCIAHSDNIIQMNNTIDRMNTTINRFDDRLSNVELRLDNLTSIDIFKDKIFYNGELFMGYSFIKDLFNNVKTSPTFLLIGMKILNLESISGTINSINIFRT